VCFTYVFGFTLNKWNWTKIFIRGSLVLGSLTLLCAGGVYWYLNAPLFPHREYELNKVKLGYSEEDVGFFFGKPVSTEDEKDKRRLIYSKDQENIQPGDMLVYLDKDKVTDALVFCTGGRVGYSIQGIGCGDTYDTVIKKFGTPSYVSIHKDGNLRILSFKKYNVYFGMEQAQVTVLGIYDPKTHSKEARRLHDEKEPPEEKPKVAASGT
jgi:hypothetical protein